jgi:ubiquitin-protein ligase E3 C
VQVYELKRGGSEVAVTKGNCVEYIHLMAHYRLNVQMHQQFHAFKRGLLSVIPAHWLSLFNQNELQVLISGAQVPIDLEDLKTNTSYTGMVTS